MKRVLTGIRPTGSLHLGHYVGALKQWLEIQDSEEYECFFLIADIQALTTHSEKPDLLKKSVREVVLDWLSVGLDPTHSNVNFVLQSQVLERHALSNLFMMIAKYSEVMRNPTLKTELDMQENATMGFMAYPVDQIADVYMVNPVPAMKEDQILVPVGADQVPHLEYARDLAIRFNNKYGRMFIPCEPLVGDIGRLVGTDGQAKMGKSTNNAIFLNDSQSVIRKKVMSMYSDPNRQNSPALLYHQAFGSDKAKTDLLVKNYQEGVIGDKQLKEALLEELEKFLTPIRIRRAEYEEENLEVILERGTGYAQTECRKVVSLMMRHMKLGYPEL